MTETTDIKTDFPIIDSHIHLYAATHLPDLSWAPSLPNGHVLKQQNSVSQYRAATQSCRNLVGFVFLETDRKSSLSNKDWTHPLEEIEFLRRIKAGTPIDGEGHDADDRSLLLGVVPWAPISTDPEALKDYLKQARAQQDLRAKDGLIRGFRYLLQDKAQGHCLDTNMHKGLLVLEQAGCKSFDLGVDHRQGGLWQLTDAVQMLQRFYAESNGQLKIVINHLCKPNLQDYTNDEEKVKDRTGWEHAMKALADLPTTYVKFSGLFSELPAQTAENPISIAELIERTRFVMDVMFDNFGPENIMFGSDWPVCNVGGPGPEKSWSHWVQFVAAVLEERALSDAEKARIWAGTAREVYGLDVDLENWKAS